MSNKYAEYRNIRYKRAFRTIGKMGPWRIVLAVLLMVFVFLMSGAVSQWFAAREMFHVAEKLMIVPSWMEQYKPETKAFIEAGVIYQDGDYEAAAEAFAAIEKYDAAVSMLSLTNSKLGAQKLAGKDPEAAYSALIAVDTSLLSDDYVQDYLATCTELCAQLESAGDKDKADALQTIIDNCSQTE